MGRLKQCVEMSLLYSDAWGKSLAILSYGERRSLPMKISYTTRETDTRLWESTLVQTVSVAGTWDQTQVPEHYWHGRWSIMRKEISAFLFSGAVCTGSEGATYLVKSFFPRC